MLDVLASGFFLRALAATVAVAIAAPLVGSFAVQRGQSLIGDGIGHVAFAGVGLAFLAGVTPMWGALTLAVLAAAALHVLRRQGLAGDVALGVVFYAGIALGFLFASKAGAAGANLLGVLFGSPLTLTTTEVATVAGLSVATSAIVLALRGRLVAVAFDEEAARVSGVRVDALSLALTVLAALVVVGGMASVGILLVGALLVVPVAAAGRVASSYAATLAFASAFGVLAAVAGLVASVAFDLAPGPAIVLAALVVYGLTAVVRR